MGDMYVATSTADTEKPATWIRLWVNAHNLTHSFLIMTHVWLISTWLAVHLVVSSVFCGGSSSWNQVCNTHRCGCYPWWGRDIWRSGGHRGLFSGEHTPVSHSGGWSCSGAHSRCGRISGQNFLRRLLWRLTFWRFTRFPWLQWLICLSLRLWRVLVAWRVTAPPRPPAIPVQPSLLPVIVRDVGIVMPAPTNLRRESERGYTQIQSDYLFTPIQQAHTVLVTNDILSEFSMKPVSCAQHVLYSVQIKGPLVLQQTETFNDWQGSHRVLWMWLLSFCGTCNLV